MGRQCQSTKSSELPELFHAWLVKQTNDTENKKKKDSEQSKQRNDRASPHLGKEQKVKLLELVLIVGLGRIDTYNALRSLTRVVCGPLHQPPRF